MTTRLRSLLLCCVALLSWAAPDLSAQSPPLDGVWFKVSVKLNGAAISGDNVVEGAKGGVVCYVFTEAVELLGNPNFPGTTYSYGVVSETSPGVWQETGSGILRAAGDHEVMVPMETGASNRGVVFDVVVPDEDSTTLTVAFVAALKVKLDKEGALKKAKFKSAGGMALEGFGDGDILVGGVKVKGANVDVEKLPFDVEMLDLGEE